MVCRIFSEKGLPYLKEEFPKLKFKGKGHEARLLVGRERERERGSNHQHYSSLQASDLRFLLQQYEYWANNLFPKLTFNDVTDRIEALGKKKDFRVLFTCLHTFVIVVYL